MTTIDEYKAAFPSEHVWQAEKDAPGQLAEGMLRFDETADYWAGPFDGGYAYFRLADMQAMPGWGPLPTVAELQRRQRFSRHNLPMRLRYGDDAQSEEHLQKRLALLTPKELKAWRIALTDWRINWPTVDKPFALKLAGNDDFSYTKFFASEKEAQAELTLLISDQPLNFHLHVQENGFEFTN